MSAEILKWKDGKKGVFFMCFDDSAPTFIATVIPELQKRKLPGTFYNIPGSDWHRKNQAFWDHPLPGIEYGNHTYTHKGVASQEELEQELQKANDEIARCFPGRPQNRLISFAKPGGVAWSLSPEATTQVLNRFHLVWRPQFEGYHMPVKTAEELCALPAKAVAEGTMEHVNFHGVGGDWLSTPTNVFLALLDALDAHRGELWITDPVSWHQYESERDSTKVHVMESTPTLLKIQLQTALDKDLYNLPLTLSSRVPKNWTECTATQGGNSTAIPVSDGRVVFDALPGGADIILQPCAPRTPSP